MISIYVIVNNVNLKNYVGQTKNPPTRWRRHKRESRMVIGRAIQKYGVDAFTFDVIEAWATQEEADEAEEFWIRYLGTRAPFGYNVQGGGRHGAEASPETRRKISEANKGRKRTPEQCANLSAQRKGRRVSAETVAKIVLKTRGQKRSEEFKAKMRGRFISEETRAKIGNIHRGMKHTEETKAKMREAKRHISEETRRKMSESAKRRKS